MVRRNGSAAAYSDSRIMFYCVLFDTFERMKSIRAGIDVWDERAGVTIMYYSMTSFLAHFSSEWNFRYSFYDRRGRSVESSDSTTSSFIGMRSRCQVCLNL